MKQLVDLFVASAGYRLLNLGVDMAVGDEDIQPPVIIVIEEAPAEAQN